MNEPEQTHQRRIGEWLVEEVLGNGSFAIVWKAQHRVTGKPAAIKEINLSRLSTRLRQSLESEVSILKRISHPNVVELYEVLEAHGRLFIVMEYCAGGDLAQLLKSKGRLQESTVSALIKDLAAGLHELHIHHLVHRDLKPQNLLVTCSFPPTATPVPTLKIADFGFARALGPQHLAETVCGSPLYMSPEILLSQPYDAKADLWSVGAILYEALCGTPPYTGINQVALLHSIKEREARLPASISAELSPECKSLIHGLLKRNAVERISFEDFFEHPFITAKSKVQQNHTIFGFNDIKNAVVGGGGSQLAAMNINAAVPVSQLTEQFKPRLISMRRPVQQPSLPIRTQRPSPRAIKVKEEEESSSIEDDYVIVNAASVIATADGTSAKTPPLQDALFPRSAPLNNFGVKEEAFLLFNEQNGKQGAAESFNNIIGGAAETSSAAATPRNSGECLLPQLDAVPWQSASKRQFFYLVAGIVDSIALDQHVPADVQLNEKHLEVMAKKLSFHLAALQLYDAVLNGFNRPDNEDNNKHRHSMHSSLASVEECMIDLEAVKIDAATALENAEAAAEILQKSELNSKKQWNLPNPWRTMHSAALEWAEEASSEELLGNYSRCENIYCKVGTVLHFLASESRTLPCNPPLELAPADEVRLRRCASAAAARRAVCAALAKKEEEEQSSSE